MKSYSLPPGDRILNPHSSRSVWSFSSLSKTKGPSRYPTTLGDRVERELLLITKQKGRIHKQREPKGPLENKDSWWNATEDCIFSFTWIHLERLILSPSWMLMKCRFGLKMMWLREAWGLNLTDFNSSLCISAFLPEIVHILVTIRVGRCPKFPLWPCLSPSLGEPYCYFPVWMCAIHHPKLNVAIGVPYSKECWKCS